MFDCGATGRRFESASCQGTLTFPPVVHGWVNKDLGMSSRVCATGHIKYLVSVIEKIRARVPVVGVFLVSFISNHHHRIE